MLFRIFGGLGIFLLGLGNFAALPAPLPIVTGACLLIGGIGLLAGI